jgi:hypothetical protein
LTGNTYILIISEKRGGGSIEKQTNAPIYIKWGFIIILTTSHH